MRASRWWGPPTLTARVVKALLLAFALVFAVLTVRQAKQFDALQASKRQLAGIVDDVLLNLPTDDVAAQAAMAVIEPAINNSRRRNAPAPLQVQPILVDLSRPSDGRIVYTSDALRGAYAPDVVEATADVTLDGRLYGMAQGTHGDWRLRMFEPKVDDARMLAFIALDLGESMLIAFPLVLLPLWFAVRQGLAPLRELTRGVQQREADDLSPIRFNFRYAELQPLEAAFNQLLGRSRQAVERERSFVQDAAHEIRTPLAVIAAQAHAMAAGDSEPVRRSALQRMENAVARASHLIHQLLTLARVEGPHSRDRVDVDCVEVIRGILVDASPRAKAQGIELTLDAPERLVLSTDLLALHSALENLVGNALTHASGATRVEVGLHRRGDRWVLAVADDGQGVPPSERDALFDRFRRGRGVQAQGSGLGLAIVRESARLLGGDLRCLDGLDGCGLRFELTLPAQRNAT